MPVGAAARSTRRHLMPAATPWPTGAMCGPAAVDEAQPRRSWPTKTRRTVASTCLTVGGAHGRSYRRPCGSLSPTYNTRSRTTGGAPLAPHHPAEERHLKHAPTTRTAEVTLDVDEGGWVTPDCGPVGRV